MGEIVIFLLGVLAGGLFVWQRGGSGKKKPSSVNRRRQQEKQKRKEKILTLFS